MKYAATLLIVLLLSGCGGPNSDYRANRAATYALSCIAAAKDAGVKVDADIIKLCHEAAHRLYQNGEKPNDP